VIRTLVAKVKTGWSDFRRGIAVLFGKSPDGKGDRALARMSKLVMAQIDAYGKQAVRSQLVRSIENDLRKAAKKGGKEAVDKVAENALATPEYMQLLQRLGLEEAHIRVMAMQALKQTPRGGCK